MPTQQIEWADGSGDKIYITSPDFSGNQQIAVSSDPNTGAARSKVVTFSAGNVSKTLTVEQAAGVPYDAEIEYLESNGTQSINTGIIVADKDTITVKAYFLTRNGDNHLLGAGSVNSNGLWLEIYNNNKWYVRFGSTASANTSGASVNTLYTLVLRKIYFSVNGTRKLVPNYSDMPSNALCLWKNGPAGVVFANARIYSLKITDNDGNDRIDLIPVRVGQTGYMYDRVSKQLFGNDGTGSFILGQDK